MIDNVVIENAVIEAMADAVLVVDNGGNVTRTNGAARALTGWSGAEILGRPIAAILVDDRSGLRTVVRERIEGGDVLRREQSWLITRSGDRIPVSVTAAPIFVAGQDGPQGIVLVAHDTRALRRLLAEREAEIIRRREVEEELRKAKSSIEDNLESTRTQLLLAERRATLGTLAGGVGHELRNIAQIQVAAVDEISLAIEANEDLKELLVQLLPDLERVGAHITEHGRRLLQLAKPGPDRVEQFDLNNVVRDAIQMLRGAGRLRRIEVHATLGGAPLFVTVNRTRIEQILVNLIVNAVDAIMEGKAGAGAITVGVHASADGKRVICDVSDTGVGIAPDALEKVFEAFYTTKGADKGTGLGLPVAREIVRSYGGDLVVRSELGVGTTFTFDLPR